MKLYNNENDDVPYREGNFEGVESRILDAKGIPANGELSRRHFMDLLAAVGGGLSLTSMLSSCDSGDEEKIGEASGPLSDDPELQEPVKIGYLPITDSVPLVLAHALGYFQD